MSLDFALKTMMSRPYILDFFQFAALIFIQIPAADRNSLMFSRTYVHHMKVLNLKDNG